VATLTMEFSPALKKALARTRKQIVAQMQRSIDKAMNDTIYGAQIHLAFNGRVSRTICGFTNEAALLDFVRTFTEEDYAKLRTVNPAKAPIYTFETAVDAFYHFGVTLRSNVKPARTPRGRRA
jgi:hypothetical protein